MGKLVFTEVKGREQKVKTKVNGSKSINKSNKN